MVQLRSRRWNFSHGLPVMRVSSSLHLISPFNSDYQLDNSLQLQLQTRGQGVQMDNHRRRQRSQPLLKRLKRKLHHLSPLSLSVQTDTSTSFRKGTHTLSVWDQIQMLNAICAKVYLRSTNWRRDSPGVQSVILTCAIIASHWKTYSSHRLKLLSHRHRTQHQPLHRLRHRTCLCKASLSTNVMVKLKSGRQLILTMNTLAFLRAIELRDETTGPMVIIDWQDLGLAKSLSSSKFQYRGSEPSTPTPLSSSNRAISRHGKCQTAPYQSRRMAELCRTRLRLKARTRDAPAMKAYLTTWTINKTKLSSHSTTVAAYSSFGTLRSLHK